MKYIDRVMAPLGKSEMEIPDAWLIRNELACTANLLRHACRLGIARIESPDKKIERIPAERRAELAAELSPLIAEYQRLWLLRNRKGGLSDSISVFNHLMNLYKVGGPDKPVDADPGDLKKKAP